MRAPAIPNRIVRTNPPGSRPGIRRLPTTPTTNPNNIHPKMLITHLLNEVQVMNAAATKERALFCLKCYQGKADTIHIPSVCAAKYLRCRNEVNVMQEPSDAHA